MRFLSLLLLCIISMTALAEKEAKILQLEKTLNSVMQESQSTYQQFLMIQELRRNAMLENPTLTPSLPTAKSIPIPSYEDLSRLQQEKNERIEKYTSDLNRLYTRYQELEKERETIFEQIKRIEQETTQEE